MQANKVYQISNEGCGQVSFPQAAWQGAVQEKTACIPLGSGRTGKLHYINRRLAEAKQDAGKVRGLGDDYKRLRAEYSQAWDDLPAREKGPYVLAAEQVRESRHFAVQQQRARRLLGIAQGDDVPMPPRDESVVNDTHDNFAPCAGIVGNWLPSITILF